MNAGVEAVTINSDESNAVENMLKTELANLHDTSDALRDDEGKLRGTNRDRFIDSARLLRKVLEAQGNSYKPVIDMIPDGDAEDHRRLWERLDGEFDTSGGEWSDCVAEETGGCA